MSKNDMTDGYYEKDAAQTILRNSTQSIVVGEVGQKIYN